MADTKVVQVQLTHLHLDPENPRHDPIDNEPEIIARLYGREKVLKLAEDIAGWGTNPLERIAVIDHPKSPGRYVVVEGNRRLCALKLLKDPAKSPTPVAKKALALLKAKAVSLPQKFEAVLFADRDAARHWLQLRHGGEQAGRGTVGWKSAQKARFDGQGASGTNPNAQALALLDYARVSDFLPASDHDSIALTTVTRYLTNPVFRNTMGLTNNVDLAINVEQTEFDRAVERFLRDAVPVASPGMAPVGSRSSSKDRVAYAHKLVREGVAPTTRLATSVIAVPSSKSKSKTKGGRHSRSPDKRPSIVPGEPPRVLRRLQLLRRWSHEQVEEVFT